jgi:hypothetical protein
MAAQRHQRRGEGGPVIGCPVGLSESGPRPEAGVPIQAEMTSDPGPQLPLFAAPDLPPPLPRQVVAPARSTGAVTADAGDAMANRALDFSAPQAPEPAATAAAPPAPPAPTPAEPPPTDTEPMSTHTIPSPKPALEPLEPIKQPRLWRDNGWTARVIKNDSDEGWAVEMIKDGEPEPALVGPWTMGRDKKNPKPLDAAAFHTWVKTASEVLRRHEQHLHATLHKEVTVPLETGRLRVTLTIVPDDDDAHALLAAHGADGDLLAQVRVPANFRLNLASASAWVDGGFRKPG